MSDELLNQIAHQCLEDAVAWFPDSAPDVVYSGLALAGEAGEYANILKKVVRGDMTLQEAMPSLADELADVFTYTMLIAGQLHFDLLTEYVKKREHNMIRFQRRDNGS
jgi:NTP pyrophosphatase (non-canonical NTP hydrolase)